MSGNEDIKGDIDQSEFLILDNCNNGESYRTMDTAMKGAAALALPDRDVVIYQAVMVVRQEVTAKPYKSAAHSSDRGQEP